MGELDDAPSTCTGLACSTGRIPALACDFRSGRQSLADIVGQGDSGLPVVAVAGTGIDRLAAAAEDAGAAREILA